jgi:hypothetical protein
MKTMKTNNIRKQLKNNYKFYIVQQANYHNKFITRL